MRCLSKPSHLSRPLDWDPTGTGPLPVTGAHGPGSPVRHCSFTGNKRGCVTHLGESPRALSGAPDCLPCLSEVNTGWEQDSQSLPVALSQGPQLPLLHRAGGGRPCRSPPSATAWRAGLAWGRGPGSRCLGPVRVCGLVGCRAEQARPREAWAGTAGVPGTRPSRPSLQLLEASTTTALFTRGHGPSGRVRYRRQEQQADSDPQPQRTQQ